MLTGSSFCDDSNGSISSKPASDSAISFSMPVTVSDAALLHPAQMAYNVLHQVMLFRGLLPSSIMAY